MSRARIMLETSRMRDQGSGHVEILFSQLALTAIFNLRFEVLGGQRRTNFLANGLDTKRLPLAEAENSGFGLNPRFYELLAFSMTIRHPASCGPSPGRSNSE